MAQPQMLQIKLSRFDAQPWGFRLQGGVDFAAPLLVQKVNGGSLAEQAGLQPGDAVLMINDVDVFNLKHKDAQDIVVRSGNNFVMTIQRGGSTWKPHVTPTGNLPQPNSPYLQTVTKTSLAHHQPESQHIGCGYNNSARPFANGGGDGNVKSIVNKQYNTPVGIYSEESIAETLSAQAEVLAGGVLGVNFKKNEKEYQPDKSEVLKFLREEESGQSSTPEPHSAVSFYATQSHAIGGSSGRQTPQHPQQQQQQPYQQQQLQQQQHQQLQQHQFQQQQLLHLQQQHKVQAMSAKIMQTSTSSSTTTAATSEKVTLAAKQQQVAATDADNIAPPADPRVIIAPVCPALQGPEYQAELAAAAAQNNDGPKPLTSASGHPACQLCGVGIVGVFVRIKDKNLHVECFRCATCGTSLKNQGYYNFNNKLYCDVHAKLAALQNPPSGTDGYVPVPIKPNTKLSANTISSALNAHGYNNGISNGNSTPTPTPQEDLTDLPLPPPPSPTQLQEYEHESQLMYTNNSNNNNTANNSTQNSHTRTNSSLSTMSSNSAGTSSASMSPIPPAQQNENTFRHNNHNNHSNSISGASTLSLDRSFGSPMHSREASSSSSSLLGSGGSSSNMPYDYEQSKGIPLPPPPPPPMPMMASNQQPLYINATKTKTENNQRNIKMLQQQQQQQQNAENDMNVQNKNVVATNTVLTAAPAITAVPTNNAYNKLLKEYSNKLLTQNGTGQQHSNNTQDTCNTTQNTAMPLKDVTRNENNNSSSHNNNNLKSQNIGNNGKSFNGIAARTFTPQQIAAASAATVPTSANANQLPVTKNANPLKFNSKQVNVNKFATPAALPTTVFPPAPPPATPLLEQIDCLNTANSINSNIKSNSSHQLDNMSMSMLENYQQQQQQQQEQSIYGEINVQNQINNFNAGQQGGQSTGDQPFEYVTLTGNVIRSVVPPGKGVNINYKVNQGYARPFGASAGGPPAGAPKSPMSYPPQQQQQQQWNQPQPAGNNYATLPRAAAGGQQGRNYSNSYNTNKHNQYTSSNKQSNYSTLQYRKSNAGPVNTGNKYATLPLPKTSSAYNRPNTPINSNYYNNNNNYNNYNNFNKADNVDERLQPQYAEECVAEEMEVAQAMRQKRISLVWPPPRDDDDSVPTAAPLYIAPPETQHVVARPVEYVPPLPPDQSSQQQERRQSQLQQQQQQVEEQLQQYQMEQQQQQQQIQQQQQAAAQWQSRSAPQLSSTLQAQELESSSDSYTSTSTTTTTTSEEYQRMYAAQAYQMQQAYEQSGSEFDYHMDIECMNAMQQQQQQEMHDYPSGRRSAQECAESLVNPLNTYKLVDMVREVTPQPTTQPSRHVVFSDEPEIKEVPCREQNEEEQIENTHTVEPIIEEQEEEERQATESAIQQDEQIYRAEVCTSQQEHYEEQQQMSSEDCLIIEDRTHILESQRLFQPTPEIVIDIPPVRHYPPTRIPNPSPKEWINPMVRVLTTAPEVPFHLSECPFPRPCEGEPQAPPPPQQQQQIAPQAPPIQAVPERAASPPPPPAEFLHEAPASGSRLTKAMVTAPEFTMQFVPPASQPIPLPEETEPYMPAPIEMKPYLREDFRPKSPFLSALTVAPEKPFESTYDRDVPIHEIDLPTPKEHLSMSDALRTAPERSYTPLNPENAWHRHEEEEQAKQKKKYEFQVLGQGEPDSILEPAESVEYYTTATKQRKSSAFAAMQAFQPTCQPLTSTSNTPTTPRPSLVSLDRQAEPDLDYEKFCKAKERNQKRLDYYHKKEEELSTQQQYQTQQQQYESRSQSITSLTNNQRSLAQTATTTASSARQATNENLYNSSTVQQQQQQQQTERKMSATAQQQQQQMERKMSATAQQQQQQMERKMSATAQQQQQQTERKMSSALQQQQQQTERKMSSSMQQQQFDRKMSSTIQEQQQQQQQQTERKMSSTIAQQQQQQTDRKMSSTSTLTSASALASSKAYSSLAQSSLNTQHSHKIDAHELIEEIAEELEHAEHPFPPPSPLSHLKHDKKTVQSGLHRPETIPKYQRNWTVLPTQSPVRTPEPQELRENVPLAFVDTPKRPSTPSAIATAAAAPTASVCSYGQPVHKPVAQQATITTAAAAVSRPSVGSLSGSLTNGQPQQQRLLSLSGGSNATATPQSLPKITSDDSRRTGSITMAFQSLDEYADQQQQHEELARTYTPTLSNKPVPMVPYYQTEEKLCFEECPATQSRMYDRQASPFPDRARSPAPGPPANPLSAIRAPRLKETAPSAVETQRGSIITGQSYLGAQQLQQHQQQQAQVLSHFESSSQAGMQSYTQKPETVEERKIGDMTIQKREQESRLEEQKRQQQQSQTTTQIGNTQIERRRKVTEEFEHTQSAKTIEIRTQSGSQMQIQSKQQSQAQKQSQAKMQIQAQAAQSKAQQQAQQSISTERRQSYGKTGFVADQARRLSTMEQEINDLSTKSAAISARAASLSDTHFPEHKMIVPDGAKFPIRPPTPVEPERPTAAAYVVSGKPEQQITAPPGFPRAQQPDHTKMSSMYGASIMQLQQQQQDQQKSYSSLTSTTTTASSINNTASSSYASSSFTAQQQQQLKTRSASIASSTNLTQASAMSLTNNKQQQQQTYTRSSLSGPSTAAAAPSCGAGGVCGGVQSFPPAPAAAANSNNRPFCPMTKSICNKQQANNFLNTKLNANANNANAAAASSAAAATAGQRQANNGAPSAATNQPRQSIDKTNVSDDDSLGGPGGKSAPAFGATSAPKRGRGVLNMAAAAGVRVPQCNSCNMQIRGPFITALGRIWCPDHFICVNGNCRRPLQDIGFVEEKGDLYCEYCFEKYLAPTCSKCNGKIKGDCLNAIGRHFHPECFSCTHCGKVFGNSPFFLEEGNPYCEADWNELFTTKCFACGFPVEAGDRWVEALNHNYHSQCFNCTFCKQNLEGQSFYNKGGRPFCKNHAR